MGFFDNITMSRGQPEPTIARCGSCGLWKKCHTPKMKVAGRGKIPILFVGEAPGETEDRQGAPFLGDAGQCLREMLHDLDFELDDAWVTNAAICRPPGNEINDDIIDACRPNLVNTIKRLQPRCVVLLGQSAVAGALTRLWGGAVGPMGRWAGWQIPNRDPPTWFCPTYHPSFVKRTNNDAALVTVTKQHLRAAIDLGTTNWHKPKTHTKEELGAKVEVITSPAKRLAWLAEEEGDLGFDYETDGLKPEAPGHRIVSVAFSLNGETTFACKIDPTLYPAISKILLSSRLRKIASNLKFEERWSIRMLGHGVTGWLWDTMLAAHVQDNRKQISSIKFQAFLRFGLGNYGASVEPYIGATTPNGFNRMADCPSLVYNGLDALIEYMVAKEQMRELGVRNV